MKKEELEQLIIDTLEFYADPDNWSRKPRTYGGRTVAIAVQDAGTNARNALKKIKAQEEA